MAGLEEKVVELAARLGLSREAVKELSALIRSADRKTPPTPAPLPGRVTHTFTTSTPEAPAAGAGEAAAGTTRSAPAAATLPTRYVQMGLLGSGGMGDVFRVQEPALNRSVALKVLRSDLSDRGQQVTRFLQEAQLTAQLQHPGIVPVYEFGRLQDDRPFFTMREVRGRTLRDAIRSVHAAVQNGQWQSAPDGWSLRRLIEAFHRVCDTIAFAHNRGVIHRDIKPHNIMLGDYGEVLVLDWGIAKLTGEPEGAAAGTDTVDASVNVPLRPATRSGSVTGTAGYMSPEQARGDAIGPQSDVFALGAVLFEILCNRPPFADREDPTVVGTATPGSAALSSKLTFPESPAVPAELKSICVRALSWDASARYANAGAFTEDLVAWLEGSKNLVRAEELLADALAEHERMDQLRREAVTLRAQASQILEAVPAFVPVAVKLPAWDLQDRAASMDKEADACSVRFRQAVWSALTFHADLPGAHRRLADHYAVEHARAETSGLSDEAAKLEVLLRDHDRGGHTSYLAGEGVFSLATDPPGATAELHRYVVRDRRLQLEKVGNLGTTPLERVSLPMGSYMVILSAEGRQTVRYPVQIRRLEFWDGVPPEGGSTAPVYLPREGELDADEIYVPAGWFWSGGSDVAIGRRSVMPRRRLWMDGFAIRRHQVTIGEYVDFLNNLVRQGRQQEASPVAPRVAGRQGELGALLLDQNPDGTYFIPANNYFGTPWHPDWPSVFVDWYGATAYAREKAARSGKRFRLPTEFEWEKAARGVDARRFPWGDFLDPTWCRMLETHAGFPTPSPAGTDEVDESPYGARDMAGNQRDWCMDVPSEQGPPVSAEGRVIGYLDSHEAWNVRVARGGNFLDSQLWCWSYHRSSFLPHVREYIISFRTARSIAGAEPQAIGMRPPSPPPAG